MAAGNPHPIGVRLRQEVINALGDAPLPRCTHLKSTRDTWVCVERVLYCAECAQTVLKRCALCERELTLLPTTYFAMELCRMGSSKRADVFIMCGCRDCAANVPLGDWGIELLEWPTISGFAVVAKYTDSKVVLCD